MTTVLQIIEDAMVDAGLLMEGASSTTDQRTKNIRRLNDLINLWQTQGLKLWLERDVSVTLVAGTVAYTVTSGGSRMTKLNYAYWQAATGGNKTPVELISREEWTRLSNNTQQGAVTQVYVEKLVTSLRVHCWLVPDATAAAGTLHVVGQVQIPNYSLVTDDLTVSFPQEWAIALRWGLADEICTGQPEVIMQRCAQKAEQFRRALDDWNVEDADTRFTPEGPAYYSREFR